MTEDLKSKIRKVLDVSEEELLRDGILSLLRERLRSVNIERLAVCKKYSVASLEELDRLVRDGKVDEFAVDEDFQHFDYLTWKAREIENLIREME